MLGRYEKLDEYTTLELQEEYRFLNSVGRLNLLKKLNKREDGIPYAIAKMVISDESDFIRSWAAKYGDSDFETRDLFDKFHEDKNPHVRASCFENPGLYLGQKTLKKAFDNASHLERLAMMRNGVLDSSVVDEIFDREKEELEITIQERKELVIAFLSNDKFAHHHFKESYWDSDTFFKEYLDGGGFAESIKYDYTNPLWEYSLTWDDHPKIQELIYAHINANDETRANVYQKTKESNTRWVILNNCNPEHEKTLQLGRNDADKDCVQKAYSKSYFNSGEWDKLIEDSREEVFKGLCENEFIPAELLSMVNDGEFAPYWAIKSIRLNELNKTIPSNDPNVLFDQVFTPHGVFLEDKIDFIGKQLATSHVEDPDEPTKNNVFNMIKKLNTTVENRFRSLLIWIILINVVVLALH